MDILKEDGINEFKIGNNLLGIFFIFIYYKYMNEYIFIIFMIFLLIFMFKYKIIKFLNIANDDYCNDIYIFKTPKKYLKNKNNLNVLLVSGTHGNENTGIVGLFKFIDFIKEKNIKIPFKSLTIVPNINKCGYEFNTRYTVHNINCDDLNRCYPNDLNSKSTNVINQKIVNLVKKSDFVLDFHDAWGFYKQNYGSIGSTLSISNHNEVKIISENIINNLNNNINKDYQKYSILNKDDHKINGTLSNYCSLLDKKYILIETSGQYNKLKLEERINQLNIILFTFIDYYKS